jgi:hypothetical protein
MADPNLFDFEGLESARLMTEREDEDLAVGTDLEAEFNPGAELFADGFPASQRFSNFADFEEADDLEEGPESEHLPMEEPVR